MKENIKLGLLGVIAITLIINTFFTDKTSSRRQSAVTPSNELVSNTITPTPSTAIPNTTSPITPKPVAPIKASESRAKTNIAFANSSHNFGEIQQDSKNTYLFEFTNTGSEPLIIEDAKGSCGCTVPVYPKEPIAPGKTGEIEVVYSPGKQQGAQTKTVTITANTNPITTTINISANVSPVK